MDDMIRHAAAVRRGTPSAWLVGDMPYMSYQPSPESAIRNAGRFMAEAGTDCIKLEGGPRKIPRGSDNSGVARATCSRVVARTVTARSEPVGAA
jgi:Ketopantoate hydroxymethyltransferase